MTLRLPRGLGVAWFGMSLACLPIGVLVYWQFFDDVLPVREEIAPSEASASDDPADAVGRRRTLDRTSMDIRRRICSARDVEVLVRRNFTDGVVYSMPDATITLAAGCADRVAQIPVPSTLPPKIWYRYDVTLSRCNPIRCEARRLVPYWVVFTGPWPPVEPLRAPDSTPLL